MLHNCFYQVYRCYFRYIPAKSSLHLKQREGTNQWDFATWELELAKAVAQTDDRWRKLSSQSSGRITETRIRQNRVRKSRHMNFQSLNFLIIPHKFNEIGFYNPGIRELFYYLQYIWLKSGRKTWILWDSRTKAALITRWTLKIKLFFSCKKIN